MTDFYVDEDQLETIFGPRRSAPEDSAEKDLAIEQLLAWLDGLSSGLEGIIIVATTNRRELLDPALRRLPVNVPLPATSTSEP